MEKLSYFLCWIISVWPQHTCHCHPSTAPISTLPATFSINPLATDSAHTTHLPLTSLTNILAIGAETVITYSNTCQYYETTVITNWLEVDPTNTHVTAFLSLPPWTNMPLPLLPSTDVSLPPSHWPHEESATAKQSLPQSTYMPLSLCLRPLTAICHSHQHACDCHCQSAATYRFNTAILPLLSPTHFIPEIGCLIKETD